MKIGLISDTHGFLDEKVFTYFAEVDEIWHAGDIGDQSVYTDLSSFKPVKAVYGNIDGPELRQDIPEVISLEVEGVNVLMIHIGGRPGKYSRQARKLIQQHQPRLFICGHSHICKVQMDTTTTHKMLYMNPGAAGIQGFHKVRTLLRFELHQGQIRNLEVIELGPRAMRLQ